MAERQSASSSSEPQVDVHEDAGIGSRQVKPTSDRSKDELKADLTRPQDEKLGVLSEPKHEADKTSLPGPKYPPIERPPISTTKPDEPVIGSLVTGAGAHEPPDPEQYDAAGRPRSE